MSDEDVFDLPGRLTPEQEVAALVSRHREASGLSQSGLAKRMTEEGHKWSQSTVYKVENEERKLTFTEGMALSRILGVRPAALVDARPEAQKFDAHMTSLMVAMHSIRLSRDAVEQCEEFLESSRHALHSEEIKEMEQALSDVRREIRYDSEA